MMEYFTRYGLEFNPFLKNSKEILVDTNERRETLFRLDYLAKTKGFGLLTGGAGRGKTTVIRTWAAGLNPSLYKVIYISRLPVLKLKTGISTSSPLRSSVSC